MSHYHITLVERQTRGSKRTECCFHVQEWSHECIEATYPVAENWGDFKKQFSSVDAIIEKLSSPIEFANLSENPEDREAAEFSLFGFDGLYDEANDPKKSKRYSCPSKCHC